MFRADLSQCETKLQKTSDEGKALKLFCSQKEEELKDLRADLAKAHKNEAELDKQVIVILKEYEKEVSLSKLELVEAHLRGAREKSSAKAKRIDELEVKLAEAMAEVEMMKVTADKTVDVYLRDAEATQTELREAFDRERQSNNLAKCQSRRETLEEIHARGFELIEEIAQAKALKADARFLISSSDDDDNEDRVASREEKKVALAKLELAETQLRGAREKSSAHAKRIDELEVKLAEAMAEVEKMKVTADKTIAVYLRDAEAAQTELREAFDRERRSNNLAKCQFRRETLEEIHARGVELIEEIAQEKALKADARFLISSSDDDDNEGNQGGSDNEDGPEEESAPEGENNPGHS
uniref:227 kDa spindle- and centromere-associated protein-like n=1 Tax=Nicotiana sylvestris TaxID=4096 RepID=A0A1U7WR86_NICSY|nr:PREDICTED: 227 kDa spindle- and centromere-associated protein-like [Nicotiana sylvestris]